MEAVDEKATRTTRSFGLSARRGPRYHQTAKNRNEVATFFFVELSSNLLDAGLVVDASPPVSVSWQAPVPCLDIRTGSKSGAVVV